MVTTTQVIVSAETKQERYIRHIRNYVGIFVIVFVACVALGVIAGMAIANQASQNNSLTNCQSLGGTNINC
jgi:cytochrome bd-type quinol oxidase subunit 1